MARLLCLLHAALFLALSLAQEASYAAQHLSSTPALPSSPSAVSDRWGHTEVPQVPLPVVMAITSQLRAAGGATTLLVGPAPDLAGSASEVSVPQTTLVHDAQWTEIPDGRSDSRMQNSTQSLTLEAALPPLTYLAAREIPNDASSPARLTDTPQLSSTQLSEKSDAVTSQNASFSQSAAATFGQETIGSQSRTYISDPSQPSGTFAGESRFLDRTVVLSRLAATSSENVATLSSFTEHPMPSAITPLDAGCSSGCHHAALLSTQEVALPSEYHPQSSATSPTALFTSMPMHISPSGVSDSVLSPSVRASELGVSGPVILSRHPPIPRSESPPLVELASSGHDSYDVFQPYSSTPAIDSHQPMESSEFRSKLFAQSSSLPSFDARLSSTKLSSVSSVVVTSQSALPPLTEDWTLKYSWHTPLSVTASSLQPSETVASVTRGVQAIALSSSSGATIRESLLVTSNVSSVRADVTIRATSVPESRGLPLLTASALSSSIPSGSTNATVSGTTTAAAQFTARVIATPASRSSTATTTTFSATTSSGATTTTTATATSTTSATTTTTPSASTSAARTPASTNVTATTTTTTHPRHVPTRTVVRDARYLFKLSGDCHLIINSTEYFQRFLAGFHDLLTKQLHIREDTYRLGDVTCGSVHVYVTFVQVPMPQFDSLLQGAVHSGGEDLIVPVWMESHFVTFTLVLVQEVPVKSMEETYNIVNEVMDEVDVIVIVVACCVCAVLVTIGVAICVKECYRRKHAQSFDLLEVPHVNLKLEDFTLTRIPRPRTIYAEGTAVKVKTMSVGSSSHNGSSNGHRVSTGAKGQVKSACIINPEDIQVRMASSSEGIIVGITCHPSAQTSGQGDAYADGTPRKSKCKNRNPSGDKRDEDHQASEKLLGSRCHGDGDGTMNPVFVDDQEVEVKDTDNGEDSD